MVLTSPFARIVVGYDDSSMAQTALRQSIALAEQYGGEVIAVHVSEFSAATVLPVSTWASTAAADLGPVLRSLESHRRDLFDELSDIVATSSVSVQMEFVMNGPGAGILDAAERWNATAIAVGTHGRTGVSRILTGSVSDEVLRNAELPVIVTQDGAIREAVERAVVGVDASEPSADATLFGVALGAQQRARLLYCTVSDTGSLAQPNADLAFDPTPLLSELRASARDALDAALQYANSADVYPDTEVIDATDVGAGLCDVARRHNADVIVIGSHKRSNFERLFIGSTAKAVIRQADRPVIVIPAHARRPAGSVPRVPVEV